MDHKCRFDTFHFFGITAILAHLYGVQTTHMNGLKRSVFIEPDLYVITWEPYRLEAIKDDTSKTQGSTVLGST